MAKSAERAGPDWHAISDRYFKTDDSIRAIGRSFGISEGAIRQHAESRGWVRPTRTSEQDVGRLGSALALRMISVDGVGKRGRCFVAAMMCLDAPLDEISEALEISPNALKAEFARELNKTR